MTSNQIAIPAVDISKGITATGCSYTQQSSKLDDHTLARTGDYSGDGWTEVGYTHRLHCNGLVYSAEVSSRKE